MPTIIKYAGPFVSMNFFKQPAIAATLEIAKLVEIKAKESFMRQRSRKNPKYTGTLFSTFEQKPISQQGNTVFKAMVIVGGAKAPYTPIVENIGWVWEDGKRKQAYFFMKEGAEKGQEASGKITMKHLKKVI